MNSTFVSPFHRFICSYSKKMSAYTNIFLLIIFMFIVMWSSTGPMNISSIGIFIIFYAYEPLNRIIFF